jgi:hypothetical protein
MQTYFEQQQPFERIEVREDGYLWLVDYKDDQSEANKNGDAALQQPLLLHSTSLLLQQLREPWHEGVVYNHLTEEDEDQEDDDNGDEDEEEEDGSNTTSTKDHDAEEEKKVEAPESSNDKANDDSHGNNKDNDDESSSEGSSPVHSKQKKEKEAQVLQRYKELKRETNLGDRIMSAIMHIQLFRHDTRQRNRRNKRDKNGNGRRETKVKALEHQRERLLQQKQKREQVQEQTDDPEEKEAETKEDAVHNENQSNQAGVVNVKEKDRKDFVPVGTKAPKDKNNIDNDDDDDDDESVASALQSPQNPYVRMIRTLNSFRALVPLILPILHHNDRDCKDLSMGRKNTRLPNKRKPFCWIIGTHVFDFATVNQFQAMQFQLQELLEFFLPRHIATNVWDSLLPDEHEFWRQEWLTYVWVPPQNTSFTHSIYLVSPYTILKELQAAEDDTSNSATSSVEDTCRKMDEKFFAEERSKKEAKKAVNEQDKYRLAVDRVQSRISQLLTKDFSGSRLSVYGSCLSNLSLKASDVDLSLYLPQAERVRKSFENGSWSPSRYEKEMAKLVREVWRKLMYRKSEFADMVPVTRARVPVVKGCYLKANNPYTPDGSLQ